MEQTQTDKPDVKNLSALQAFAEQMDSLRADFYVFSGSREVVVHPENISPDEIPEEISKFVLVLIDSPSQTPVEYTFDHSLIGITLSQDSSDLPDMAAVIDYRKTGSEDRSTHFTYLSQLLLNFSRAYTSEIKSGNQLEHISNELSLTYEELVLLYNLSTNMKVTRSNATYLQLAVDQLLQLIDVEGIAILLKRNVHGQPDYILTAGAGYVTIDPEMTELLEQRLIEELKGGQEAILDSDVDSPHKYEWPERVKNIMAVPLQNKDKLFGIMLATNRRQKSDFDSIDLKLFTSVANQCATFVENDRLFSDLKELFIGSLKSLTNSIDAKDQYTRGHSERVAFISRWIAEKYSEKHELDEDQIHRIYLAGLLHDIGKIGVSEDVLRKTGKLDSDEMQQIKTHPRIGADILNDITQMRHVVPGVLCHHERPDGKGYPKGLTNDEIPLIAKIINLADSFDAMTSRRTYRDAMSIKRALEEVRKGVGTQFDSEVANVFLNSDIQKLWNIIHDGFIESWDYSNFNEYGQVAVGALLK